MSTIAEHLATMEMYHANNKDHLFYEEMVLLIRTHWKELIDLQGDSAMEEARTTVELVIHKYHGEKSEKFIQKWHAAIAASTPKNKP